MTEHTVQVGGDAKTPRRSNSLGEKKESVSSSNGTGLKVTAIVLSAMMTILTPSVAYVLRGVNDNATKNAVQDATIEAASTSSAERIQLLANAVQDLRRSIEAHARAPAHPDAVLPDDVQAAIRSVEKQQEIRGRGASS